MFKVEDIDNLISFHESTLQSMDSVSKMIGVNNAFVEMTASVAKESIKTTIDALREFRDMLNLRSMIDGG